jgi:energy-coupling factor transporter transmembrane protein EcfT
MNEHVYNAMVSRGYRGETPALDRFKLRAADWLWLLFTAAVIILFLFAQKSLQIPLFEKPSLYCLFL